jgi:hypothetical protein
MRRILFLLIPATIVGCASSGSTKTTTTTPSSSTTRGSATRRTTLISAEEIAQGTFATAADIVLSLRPQWDHVPIYINNTPSGNFNELGQLAANTVKEIRFMSASEAQMKWGTGVQRVIWVITK